LNSVNNFVASHGNTTLLVMFITGMVEILWIAFELYFFKPEVKKIRKWLIVGSVLLVAIPTSIYLLMIGVTSLRA